MNILFIHQNFPAQFKHLAPVLVDQGHKVIAMHMRSIHEDDWQGVQLVPYQAARGSTRGVHPWLVDLETKVIRAEACFRKARELKQEGFVPDLILAHHGWGESMFIKEVWPQARLGLYCEFYYNTEEGDVSFDPEFPNPDADAEACRLQLKNLNNLLHFQFTDAAISPTRWQASTFPDSFRKRITVVHDGIDTERVAPNPKASLSVRMRDGGEISLTPELEVITFVNRNLEPYRGYHIFMRSLPELLKRRPRARVLIVGGDEVSYGAKPDPQLYGKRSWRQIFQDEVSSQISDADWTRVHFVGKVPYAQFVSLLQLSTVHVYLTYPFVLSWSLLEAMSAGCAIVASDTRPLQEAISHEETGLLVDFFDQQALVDAVCRLLENPEQRKRLGEKAREFAVLHYDLKKVCLPRQLAWVEELAAGRD